MGESAAADPLAARPTPASRRWSCCWVKYFNLTAIAGLSVAVGFMFLQLQYVTYQLSLVKNQLVSLTNQVNNETHDQIQTLNEKVQQNESFTILQMAGTFVLLTCLFTMFHITSHLRSYHVPVIQRKVMAILWMSPIYGITSFLSLMIPMLEGYLSIVKDFYEAYVIYTFLSFLIAVLGRGDRSVAVEVLSKHADHLKPPRKCFRSFYHPPPEESPAAKASAVLMECQILAMQFVFCRPLTSVASFVIITLTTNSQDPEDDDGQTALQVQKYFTSPLFWISMLQNMSVFLAFAGLLKFYHAVNEDLAWIQPFSKFLCIKGVVFMTFWQGLVINIIVSLHEGGRWEDDSSTETPREMAARIQNVLICLEMLFFSIAHWCIFPSEEWAEGYSRSKLPNPGMGFSDFVSDMNIIVESSKQAKRQRQGQDGNYIPADDFGEEDDLDLTEEDVGGKLA